MKRFVKHLNRRTRLGIIAGELFNTYRDYDVINHKVMPYLIKWDAYNEFGISLNKKDVNYIIHEIKNLERITKKIREKNDTA